MEPYKQFGENLAAASKYVNMYVELRKLKGLGARGALDGENKYLLWLPRAAIVSSVGALDQFFHQTLYAKVPSLLSESPTDLPVELCELVLRIVKINKANDVQSHFHLISSPTGADKVFHRIKDEVLQFASYQDPNKVVHGFKIIGFKDILDDVSNSWQGPNTSRDDIAKRLASYVKRRNQIAHEGDLDGKYQPRSVTPQYARDCIQFIKGLAFRLNGITFGWPEGQTLDEAS